ncbi:uncharacterized protein PAC_13476 [Phialocephala subalpina]|uniref:BTB domain-containing protein n=1 Tax=Phialocephala subalpina TaxID=576137 RepID=A0A1L7XEV4_9HELO|nr:uncharacterized protein PAC_13476 [Phialocephala subalpina]
MTNNPASVKANLDSISEILRRVGSDNMTAKAATRSSSRTSSSNSTSAPAQTPHQGQASGSTGATTTRVSTSILQSTVQLQAQAQKQKAQDQPSAILPPQKKQKMDNITVNPKSAAGQQPATAKKPRNAFSSSLGVDTVVILVGDEQASLSLHKSRLCAVSDFFEKAFNGPFKDFVEWLYHGIMTLSGTFDEKLSHLVDTYLFADRVMSRSLKNYAMDTLQDLMYNQARGYCMHHNSSIKLLPAACVKKVFENTLSSKESPIRTFCAALASHWLVNYGSEEKVEAFFAIKGFLKEFADYQSSAKTNVYSIDEMWDSDFPCLVDDPRIRGRYFSYQWDDDERHVGHEVCFFHVHDKGEKCASKTNYIYVDDSD